MTRAVQTEPCARELACGRRREIDAGCHHLELLAAPDARGDEVVTHLVPEDHLRLLRDGDSLICEVGDGTSTSPHLRRAAITDEGGRGLFLVAQLSRRWGTRYTDRGKIIWAEQSLDAGTTGGLGALLMADL